VARRRIEVSDVVEVLVHWQARRSLKQIARSTGMARNTIKRYLGLAARAGITREPALSRGELAARLREKGERELGDRYRAELEACREEIAEGIKASSMATVWQRLHAGGRLSCSVVTFRRYVRRELREVDPDRVTVRRPPAALGELAEIDFGVLGNWVDPHTQRRRRLWAFLMVLGASRHMFVRPVWALDLKTWIRCHVEAVEFFGTVPRRWVVDNLKDGVVRASLYVEIFDGEELLKVHVRVAAGQRQTDWSDYPIGKAAFFVRNHAWCRQQARLLGPNVGELVEALLADQALHHLRQAQAVLRLAEVYPPERLEAACRLASQADGRYVTVRNLLRSGRDRLPAEVAEERANHAPAFLHGRQVVLAGGIS
jgi:transposase